MDRKGGIFRVWHEKGQVAEQCLPRVTTCVMAREGTVYPVKTRMVVGGTGSEQKANRNS